MGVLEGKVALVTGASRGVGAAVAKPLAGESAAVLVNYRKSAERAEEVVRDIRKSGGEALTQRADITDEAAVGEMVRVADDAFGAVDIL